jgi:hypothetical protein
MSSHHDHHDHSDSSILWAACKNGTIDDVKQAIRSGCHVNAMDEKHYNRTALMFASMKGNVGRLYLISHEYHLIS